MVRRPSIQQTLPAIFKNVRSHSFVFQSPGVPIFSPVLDAASNPPQIIAGGDDELRLNQFTQAFIDKTRLYNIPGQALSFNAQPPLPNSSSDAPPCSQNTFVTLNQGTTVESANSRRDGPYPTGAVLIVRDAQTEQSGGQTQVIGVSCPRQVTKGDEHGQAGDAMQPLVLSVGSSFSPQESIHSTEVEVPSDPAAVAAAQALSIGQTTFGVDRVDNDIEMTDVQAASSKPTNASTQAPSTREDDQASAQLQVGAPDSDIQAQGTAQAPVAIDEDKENERPTQDNATAAPVPTDDNVQFFSLSRAEEQNGTFAETGV
ncbi:hypothetical protein NDA18_002334 [Ustilago nuda]|nr:hypothetical protein NDA18_002334 [Ustilago nuda]